FSNVGPGPHTVIAKDANECSDTKEVTINEPAELTVTLGDVSCGNGSTISATVGGGNAGPLTYSWEILGGSFNPVPGATDSSATYNTSGGAISIKVTVTDSKGCTATFTSSGDCS